MHALAVLVVLTSVCTSFSLFYRVRTPNLRSSGDVRAHGPCTVLLTWLSNDNDYCTANLPAHPLAGSVVPALAVPLHAAQNCGPTGMG